MVAIPANTLEYTRQCLPCLDLVLDHQPAEDGTLEATDAKLIRVGATNRHII